MNNRPQTVRVVYERLLAQANAYRGETAMARFYHRAMLEAEAMLTALQFDQRHPSLQDRIKGFRAGECTEDFFPAGCTRRLCDELRNSGVANRLCLEAMAEARLGGEIAVAQRLENLLVMLQELNDFRVLQLEDGATDDSKEREFNVEMVRLQNWLPIPNATPSPKKLQKSYSGQESDELPLPPPGNLLDLWSLLDRPRAKGKTDVQIAKDFSPERGESYLKQLKSRASERTIRKWKKRVN